MSGWRRQTGARLMRSELTGRVYVITAWQVAPDGLVVANKKVDVTDEFEALALAFVAALGDDEVAS